MAYAVKDFKELIVWQRGVELVDAVYRVTAMLPKEEGYGLVSQMRRCAVSIPSNIAEGKKRGTLKDYVQFLRIADGSSAELETQVIIARRFYGTLDFSPVEDLLGEVQRMLAVMLVKLEQKKRERA